MVILKLCNQENIYGNYLWNVMVYVIILFSIIKLCIFLIFCFNTGVQSVIQTNLELTKYLKQGLNLWHFLEFPTEASRVLGWWRRTTTHDVDY